MPTGTETKAADDIRLCETLAGRLGCRVEGVARVRPATRDGWVSWAANAGFWGASDYATIVTGTVAIAATASGHERRRARAAGLATRMALAATEHGAHLFAMRAMGRIVGDHVMALPYGLVADVTVRRKGSAWAGAPLAVVTVQLTDGSKVKLAGDAAYRQVYEQLQDRAAAAPPLSDCG